MRSHGNVLALTERVLNACWPLPGAPPPRYVPPPHFIRPGIVTHPVPFFGDLGSAVVLTIGVNPSSTEFSPWRGWSQQRMLPQDLCHRLLGYFKCTRCRPHPWFAEIEEALNILGRSYGKDAAHLDLSPRATRSMRTFKSSDDKREFVKMLQEDVVWLGEALSCASQARLIVFVGHVLDVVDPHGIGVGDFLRSNSKELCETLNGRRWPQVPCSKSRLAERVFRCRSVLRGHLATNG
jgi:hypothetical protein